MKDVIRTETEMKDSGIQWLGNIPKEWRIIKGKYILKQLSRSVLESDGVVTCFRDGEVTLRSNRRESGFTNSLKETGYQGVEPGDLVVHGMDGFAGAIGISDSRGKMSPIINVLESGECKKYLMYYLRGLAFVDVFVGLSTGIRERSCDLRWNKLANLEYIIPPLSEQQVIADYLDEKCEKIDEIIAEAKASIDEYKKLKQSVIFEAVTKGLDKNVEMKNSGIEWIGEIPLTWRLTKVRRVIEQSKNGIKIGPFGSALTNKTNGDAPIFIYGQANLVANDFSFAKNRITEETYNNLSSYEVAPGDICLSMMGTIGKCHTVPENINKGIMDSHLIKIRLNNLMTNRYFEYVYDKDFSGICFIQMQYDKKGSIMDGLNTSVVKGLILPLPTKQEQQNISNYLDIEVPKYDALISEKESLIKDLEAYKKSLIYEVVTGKRRVV